MIRFASRRILSSQMSFSFVDTLSFVDYSSKQGQEVGMKAPVNSGYRHVEHIDIRVSIEDSNIASRLRVMTKPGSCQHHVDMNVLMSNGPLGAYLRTHLSLRWV